MQDVQTHAQSAQVNNVNSRLEGRPEGTITPRILLDEMVMQPRRAAFVSFVSVTDPDVNKTVVDDDGNRDRTTYNEFWDREKGLLIEKVSTVQAIINANYGNSVDNALERAGIDPNANGTDFEVSEHSWANHVDGAPLVQHKYSGRYYLAVHVQRRMVESTYRWKESGEPLSDAELDELFTKYYSGSTSSKKQSEAGLSEDEQVVYRNYKASSVREIKMGGHHWMIESGV